MPRQVSNKKITAHLIKYSNPTQGGIDVGMRGNVPDVVYVPEIYDWLTVKIGEERVIVHDDGVVLSGTTQGNIIPNTTVSSECELCKSRFFKKQQNQIYCSHACKVLDQNQKKRI